MRSYRFLYHRVKFYFFWVVCVVTFGCVVSFGCKVLLVCLPLHFALMVLHTHATITKPAPNFHYSFLDWFSFPMFPNWCIRWSFLSATILKCRSAVRIQCFVLHCNTLSKAARSTSTWGTLCTVQVLYLLHCSLRECFKFTRNCTQCFLPSCSFQCM